MHFNSGPNDVQLTLDALYKSHLVNWPQVALFSEKLCFCVKIGAFGGFSGEKDDHFNTWIVKITIKTDQMDIAFSLALGVDKIKEKNMFVCLS